MLPDQQQNLIVSSIRAALRSLPESARLVLLLAVYDGMHALELSLLLDVDPESVRRVREYALSFIEKRLPEMQERLERVVLIAFIKTAYEKDIEECLSKANLYRDLRYDETAEGKALYKEMTDEE